jgi:DNA-binding transcriptional regulator YiaG
MNWNEEPVLETLNKKIAEFGDKRGPKELLTLSLLHYRVGKGLTKAHLAKILQIPTFTLARWEDGKSFPRPTMLVNLRNKLV